MTADEARQRAILSLLDVVEELCQGLAASQTPEQAWADIVTSTFADHRRELLDPESFTTTGRYEEQS